MCSKLSFQDKYKGYLKHRKENKVVGVTKMAKNKNSLVKGSSM